MATPNTNSKSNLSNDQRTALYQELLTVSTNGTLSREKMETVCKAFGVHSSTGWRIWKRGNDSKSTGACADVKSRKHLSGRKKIYTTDEIEKRIKAAPVHRRQTHRSLAAATGLSKWTIWNFIRQKWITPRTSWSKPKLKPEHKTQRMSFCSMHLSDVGQREFNDMFNVVHIDEKWFYLTKIRRRFYMWHDEAAPTRSLQSKSHITKVAGRSWRPP
ncbi:hypothetical protein H310_04301 [Aphanomyces invadans]|uniref:DUF7769 domain-containing protein n=1 Tax=Aphanomyces invadans TaxID=157072 RepID=A0A024UGS3_9STRA|nr:hypothetical protein H310_04301 [Aphanomyces invadans]ETW05385.1 hypothetical protein H310_04301 [Aphanomyces invadans]|eukprot:XP_008866823.1 hypothetical protein H310_04301 [Aphanomyces invadans]